MIQMRMMHDQSKIKQNSHDSCTLLQYKGKLALLRQDNTVCTDLSQALPILFQSNPGLLPLGLLSSQGLLTLHLSCVCISHNLGR